VVKQDTETVSRVPAKKTVYASIYVGSSQAEMIDLASSSAKVTEVQHDPDYTYKDVSSKVTATVKDETENDSNVTFSVTSKNSTNQAVYGYNYILIYDADDTLLGVTSLSIYLDKKATNTSTSGYISKYTYPAYDHFEIVTQAYYKARNK
jgi:archaellin